MTISSTPRIAGPFTGTGVLVPYPFSFKVFQTSDLLITTTNSGGLITTLALSTDYTVALNADQDVSPGGTINLIAALPVGSTMIATSNIPATQPASLSNLGAFFPKVIEAALDRLTILFQQLGYVGITQALRVPEIGGVTAFPDAATRANTTVGFDSAGNPTVLTPVSGSASDVLTRLADTANAAKGPALVGYNATLAYADGTVGAKLSFSTSVKDLPFGAVGDGVADDTAAIAAAWAASRQLDFPAGTYKVSSLPNFAYNGARIRGIGEVWINFTGTGNAMTVDNGATPGGKNYNIVIENIGINGTASCTHGLYIRGITHSTFRRIRTRNVVTAGARCEFMVSNLFDEFCHSGNEAGMTILTVNGVIFEKRGTGEQCSDCTWINPVIEGTSGDGLLLNEAAVNTFIGGTSEGNGYGGGAGAVKIGPNSFGNTFIGLDMEFNGVLGDATSYHVKDSGLRTRFINPFCDAELSGLFWIAGGNSCAIDGGQVADLQIDSGVKNFHTVGVAYTGTITDNGTDTRRLQEYSVSGGMTLADSQQQVVAWTPTVSGLTVVGTPTYTGTYQKIGRLVVFTITVTSTTSTANPGGAIFSLPIAADALGTCSAASNNSGLGVGAGSGAVAAAVCYPPTWSADNSVTISGSYFTA